MKRTPPAILLFTLSLLAGGAAFAQQAANYPVRPLRVLVPFAPGGASDFVARIVQPKLGEVLGQTVVVDNRAGASGNIGVEVSARATPDGYTLFLGNIGTMAINPSVYPKFPVRPLRDLIAITQVVDVPTALAVHPSVPAGSVKAFIAYVKARPGKLNFGSAGAGSNGRLEMESFLLETGLKMVHVPYKGGAGAANIALVGGEVQAGMLTTASVIPHFKAGRLKVVGVAAKKRVPALASVPTMPESGFPKMTTGSWQGMYVPAGTPREIVNKLHGVLIKVMGDAEVVRRIELGGADVITSKSPAEFAAFMKAENDRFAILVKNVGAAVQ
ncbi:MAG: hypothetical protein A3I02_11355 [Betaproteobacteria bacterium RIFCSPLOWO2_02_FULL_67_26]|nr:MAG: hypothetical protein A3I02_11355 [Betaproteobacteria bacterium RIFCSPLOWO2_02_FULL_67_26]